MIPPSSGSQDASDATPRARTRQPRRRRPVWFTACVHGEQPRRSAACRGAAGKVVRVLVVAANRYFFDRCPQHAAGIAYRVLFSSVPLAVVLVSVFGVMLGSEAFNVALFTTMVYARPADTWNS